MATILVHFAAMLNAGLGPVYQPGSSRPVVPTPVTVQGVHSPKPIPAFCWH